MFLYDIDNVFPRNQANDISSSKIVGTYQNYFKKWHILGKNISFP